ncbi:MAG: DUF1289 domain-containing protein [Methylococcaceae bacterium]|nr:DUF1289 domain-containing protein [Methylococcaceae bacterium]
MTAPQPSIPSPCVRNCCLNQDNICLGCFRSLDEICQWSQADDQTRLTILCNADQRRLRSSRRQANPYRLNRTDG